MRPHFINNDGVEYEDMYDGFGNEEYYRGQIVKLNSTNQCHVDHDHMLNWACHGYGFYQFDEGA